MTDIVERLNEIQLHLRVASAETKTVYEVGQICADAKVEIELLRLKLMNVTGYALDIADACKRLADEASRAALGEGK